MTIANRVRLELDDGGKVIYFYTKRALIINQGEIKVKNGILYEKKEILDIVKNNKVFHSVYDNRENFMKNYRCDVFYVPLNPDPNSLSKSEIKDFYVSNNDLVYYDCMIPYFYSRNGKKNFDIIIKLVDCKDETVVAVKDIFA